MVYKWYILPIGGLYATYHLLGEPETTIEVLFDVLLSWLVNLPPLTYPPRNKAPQKYCQLGDGRLATYLPPFRGVSASQPWMKCKPGTSQLHWSGPPFADRC